MIKFPFLKEHFKNKHGGIRETNFLLDYFRFPVNELNSERAKLLWLVKLRWLATALFFILTAPALIFGYVGRHDISSYIGLLGILIVFNFITQGYLNDKKNKIQPTTICFHLAFDLIILSFLLFFAGGFTNPFVILFMLNASLGGILIPDRLSLPFLALTHSLMAALQFEFFAANAFTNVNALNLTTIAIYHLLVFSFWFVMRSLGRSLERQHKMQVATKIQSEKQDRLRAIGALAAGFSHEFASPLNSAKLRVARVLRQAPQEDLQEALSAIESCEQIIRQMNSSQLDARDHQFKSVNLKDLSLDVIDSWKDLNPQCNLHLDIVDIGNISIPPINYAQILLNLLDNSYQANPSGKISLRLHADDNLVSLVVEDQGPGFPSLVLEKFGEPFVTTKRDGTGLGLYVTQLFAQALGGDLKIYNRSNHGAVVDLKWPLKSGDVL